MKHKPMEFQELDRLHRYDAETGDIFHKIDKGRKDGGGRQAKAGEIATNKTGGYLAVRFRRNGRRVGYLAHRVAWLLYYGVDPGEKEIDHIDGNPVNNKISNLRLVDHQGNMRNKRKRSTNTSGVQGVSWHKGTGKWRAYIADRGEQQYLGIFEDKFEAICCRKSAERRIGYHKNHGK